MLNLLKASRELLRFLFSFGTCLKFVKGNLKSLKLLQTVFNSYTFLLQKIPSSLDGL